MHMRQHQFSSFLVMTLVVSWAGVSEPAIPIDAPACIYVVEVTAPDETTLAALLERDYIVSNVTGYTATLYVDEYDYRAMDVLGLPWRLVEIQPGGVPAEKADAYTSYEELGAILAQYADEYPNLCRVISLGQSVNRRDLWAVMITENPDIPADKPAVKYIATMHGDEPVGTELCLYFAEELLTQYGTDNYITDLLGRTIIWLVPLMNPDGYVQQTRVNANLVDLNRAFPIYPSEYSGTWFDGEPLGEVGREPEVAHIMRWSAETHAALSANFHTGTLVVNYPYDNAPGVPSRVEAPTPDDDLFRYISLQYSMHNEPMYNSIAFPQGITNGSLWYSITGGMMDWNYRFMGCPEVTLEVSHIKWPSAATLPQLWEDNRDAMYAYIETVHIGVRGLTRDRNTDAPVWAKVLIDGNIQPVFSNPEFGNYHRLILPGEYDVSFHAEGYISYYVDNVLVEEGPATRVDVPISDGDVNGDGIVDMQDVHLVVDAALGRDIPYDADVDGRGISATDIQAVINRLS